MKEIVLAIGIAAAAGIAAVSAFPPGYFLIWNRTESAPKGLYFITRDNPVTGEWAVLSADAASAEWIAANGYLGTQWPVIKRVAASEGDEICRSDNEVFINEFLAAMALDRDRAGKKFPRWEGCITLQPDEVFLLNNHPRSLDGRYFGTEKRDDLIGRGLLLFRAE